MPNRFERALEQREEATQGATQEFRNFDPREAAQESARAQFGAFEEDLREGMERLRGRQVGAGRLQTGFGMEDQDRFVRDRLDRLDRALAQRATDMASMRQQQLGRAAGMQGRLLRMRRQERNRSEQQAGSLGGAIGSVVGGVGGFLAGGPAGAAAGSQIGGGAGRGIAQLF